MRTLFEARFTVLLSTELTTLEWLCGRAQRLVQSPGALVHIRSLCFLYDGHSIRKNLTLQLCVSLPLPVLGYFVVEDYLLAKFELLVLLLLTPSIFIRSSYVFHCVQKGSRLVKHIEYVLLHRVNLSFLLGRELTKRLPLPIVDWD
jgi:hypothetical protein